MGKEMEAKNWLTTLVHRVDFSFKVARGFPVGTDSIDDLIELDFAEPSRERRNELMQTSWTLPTLAGWAAIFGADDVYGRLVEGQKDESSHKVCRQLWHPAKDIFEHLYFRESRFATGETDAPIVFDEDMGDYRKKMRFIMESARYEFVKNSPSYEANLFGLDFIACRHFRTPVAPSFWYQFLADEEVSAHCDDQD